MNSSRSYLDLLRTAKQVLTYGNGVVISCFAVMFLLYGSVLNTFTVFLKPIVEDLGWGRGTLSFAMAMGALGMGVSAPIAGKLIDRMGARPLMIAGSLMIGIGILVASRIMFPWQVYIIYAFIGCGLACASVIPCSLIISNWFISRRGMAMGMMAMGTSIGGMCVTPIANWIIYNHSWRFAYVFSGLIILLLGVPLIVLRIRPHPSDAGFEPFVDPDLPVENADSSWGLSVKEAFSSLAFWQISAVMIIIGVVTSALGTHTAPQLMDLGHSPTAAAFSWVGVLLVMTIAKFSFGPIADRWGPKNAMSAASIVVAISILALAYAQPFSLVIVFIALYGFGVGAPMTVAHGLYRGWPSGWRLAWHEELRGDIWYAQSHVDHRVRYRACVGGKSI